MLGFISDMDTLTQLQYSLMLLFGTITVLGAFSPLALTERAVLTGVALGITVGLWLSHLVKMLFLSAYQAKQEQRGETNE